MYRIYELTGNQRELQEEIVALFKRATIPQIGDTEEFTQEDLEAEAELLAVKFAK